MVVKLPHLNFLAENTTPVNLLDLLLTYLTKCLTPGQPFPNKIMACSDGNNPPIIWQQMLKSAMVAVPVPVCTTYIFLFCFLISLTQLQKNVMREVGQRTVVGLLNFPESSYYL